MEAALGLGSFCLVYYLLAGLGVALGYHRVLTHRALRLPRLLEWTFVTLGLPAGTPIQWVGNHRHHHAHADQPGDPHSPVLDGFWFAHVGWYIQTKNPLLCLLYSLAGPLRMLFDGWHRPRTNQQYVHLAPDVAKDPYYRFVSHRAVFFVVCALHVAVPFAFVAWMWGPVGVAALWVNLVVIYNGADAVDSLSHLYGPHPYATEDASRNNVFVALLAQGEGWHANHHAFPSSAKHGLLPWQVDWTWQVIRLLRLVRLCSHVRVPSQEELERKLQPRAAQQPVPTET